VLQSTVFLSFFFSTHSADKVSGFALNQTKKIPIYGIILWWFVNRSNAQLSFQFNLLLKLDLLSDINFIVTDERKKDEKCGNAAFFNTFFSLSSHFYAILFSVNLSMARSRFHINLSCSIRDSLNDHRFQITIYELLAWLKHTYAAYKPSC
jgi:hypothetical protein